jgi:hypothetical protein
MSYFTDYLQIALSKENVVILDHAEISVWKIPPMQNRVRDVEPILGGQKPLICVPYAAQDILRVALNPSWYLAISPSTEWSVYFDVLHDMDHTSGLLSRYLIHPLQDDPMGRLPHYIPIETEQSRLHNISAGSGRNALSVRSGSDEDFFLMWREGNMLFIHLSTIAEHGGRLQSFIVPIVAPRPSLATYGHMGCCPVSGRVVMVCPDGHIHVMDYLMPPT